MADNKHIKTVLKKRADLLKIAEKKTEISGKQIDGLGFLLSEERYAIDSTYVSEVVPLKDLTPLPCTPAFVIGIINVRGKILSVIDLKEFFNLATKGISNLNRVIVVKHNDIELGILADEISGNTIINIDQLQTNVSTISEANKNFIIGVTVDRLIVLDVRELLLSDRIIIDEEVDG